MRNEILVLLFTISGYNLVGCSQATPRIEKPTRPVIPPSGEIFNCSPSILAGPGKTPYVKTVDEETGEVIFNRTPYKFQFQKGKYYYYMGNDPEVGLIGDSDRKGVFCETELAIGTGNPDEDSIPTFDLVKEIP